MSKLEAFREVEPFKFCGVNYARVDGCALLIPERAFMSVELAKRFYSWLKRALPCEHRFLTGSRLVDPFGKSDARRNVENECIDCGFVAISEGKP